MVSQDKVINVLYALSDKNGTYSKLAGTSICSMLENTKDKVMIHIFHDGSIDGKNRQNFDDLVRDYKQKIKFYNAREMLPKVWQKAEEIFPKAVRDTRYTEAALYRLLAPQLLDLKIKKLIYLDADTVVNLNICELWQEKVGSGGLAAVRETNMMSRYGMEGATEDIAIQHMQDKGVNVLNYFNSGVLLFDLEKLRKMGNLLLKGLEVLAKHPHDSKYHDQSILNYYFAENLTPLSNIYNISIEWDKTLGKKPKQNLEPGIYHYLGFHLGLDVSDPRDVLYFKYFLKTPWCTAEFFCKFFDTFNQLSKSYYIPRSIEQGMTLRLMVSALSYKSLVIAATEEFMPKVVEILENPHKLSDDEDTSIKETLSTLPKEARMCSLGSNNKLKLELSYDVEKHFYLLFVPDYPRVHALLSASGLKEGEDYLDGSSLLDERAWMGVSVNVQLVFEKT